MPSGNTYRLTWVSLTFNEGYLFMAAPAKRRLLLTLGEGYLLTAAPPDLEREVHFKLLNQRELVIYTTHEILLNIL